LGVGSSPRVRGTHYLLAGLSCRCRIIPACAGNTNCRDPKGPPDSDHPRVCGEHASVQSIRTPRIGSSPRVRGTLQGVIEDDQYVRIIPACAGNTLALHGGVHLYPDHPRVCGEHGNGSSQNINCGGSSPRVRGTQSL